MGDGAIASPFVTPSRFPTCSGAAGRGITAAFIPLFKQGENRGDKAMWHTANAVVSALVVILRW
ncbi:MAG: hypothetical protein CM1200mP29_00200 [Verrucomicrobiota bacterium]|nr:MAG: hypothetical protein CM1200mP29_00200 [Verrucomicrobiota bacterium]